MYFCRLSISYYFPIEPYTITVRTISTRLYLDKRIVRYISNYNSTDL